jgi:uncharacterized MAPEG superfamily protein
MSLEVEMLFLTVFLGIANILVVSHVASWQRGYRWTASFREDPVPPLAGRAGRLQRSLSNLLEDLSVFRCRLLRRCRDRYP